MNRIRNTEKAFIRIIIIIIFRKGEEINLETNCMSFAREMLKYPNFHFRSLADARFN